LSQLQRAQTQAIIQSGYLRVDPTQFQCVRNLIDGENVRSNAKSHLMPGCGIINSVERLSHHSYKSPVDAIQRPEISRAILCPFEIGNSYPAGIRKNIRNHENPFFKKDRICARIGWSVCTFTNN